MKRRLIRWLLRVSGWRQIIVPTGAVLYTMDGGLAADDVVIEEGATLIFGPPPEITQNALEAFESGRQQGMTQERALWELAALGQEIERTSGATEPGKDVYCPRCAVWFVGTPGQHCSCGARVETTGGATAL